MVAIQEHIRLNRRAILIVIIIAAVVVPNFNISAVVSDPGVQLTLFGRIDLPVYLVSMTFLYH